jgi:hypothetical protein
VKTFHHSSLDSPRIKKLLAFLEARGAQGATTIEITTACVTTRASSDVAELRACLVGTAKRIETTYEGENENKRRVHRYVLKSDEVRQSAFASAFKSMQNLVATSPEQAATVQPEFGL